MNFEELLLKYALPVVVMAAIVLVLVGIIKIFTKCLQKDNSKLSKVMSYIYVIMAAGATVGVVCAYYGIFHLTFDPWRMFVDSGKVFCCSQALYPIYRDYGGRWLLLKFCGLFKGKDTKTDELIAVIEQVVFLSDKQKGQLTDKLNNK